MAKSHGLRILAYGNWTLEVISKGVRQGDTWDLLNPNPQADGGRSAHPDPFIKTWFDGTTFFGPVEQDKVLSHGRVDVWIGYLTNQDSTDIEVTATEPVKNQFCIVKSDFDGKKVTGNDRISVALTRELAEQMQQKDPERGKLDLSSEDLQDLVEAN